MESLKLREVGGLWIFWIWTGGRVSVLSLRADLRDSKNFRKIRKIRHSSPFILEPPNWKILSTSKYTHKYSQKFWQKIYRQRISALTASFGSAPPAQALRSWVADLPASDAPPGLAITLVEPHGYNHPPPIRVAQPLLLSSIIPN